MEPKPKERIVFDEDSYYGDEGEEMAIIRHPARCGRWRLFPFGGSERSRPLALHSPGEQESRPRYDSETE